MTLDWHRKYGGVILNWSCLHSTQTQLSQSHLHLCHTLFWKERSSALFLTCLPSFSLVASHSLYKATIWNDFHTATWEDFVPRCPSNLIAPHLLEELSIFYLIYFFIFLSDDKLIAWLTPHIIAHRLCFETRSRFDSQIHHSVLIWRLGFEK